MIASMAKRGHLHKLQQRSPTLATLFDRWHSVKNAVHQSSNYKKTNKNSLIIACSYFAIWAYVPLMYDDDVYSDSEYFWMSAAALIKYLAQTTSTWWITVWPRPVQSLGKKNLLKHKAKLKWCDRNTWTREYICTCSHITLGKAANV